MQKATNQIKPKIIEKVQLKNKMLVKSVIAEKSELMVTRFGNEDTMAACGYSDGFVRIFNLSTDNKISQINVNNKPKEGAPINCLRWRPQSKQSSSSSVILVGSTNGQVFQFASKTGKQLFQTTQQDNQILALDYHPQGLNFATTGKDNIVRIYDQQTKTIVEQLKGTKWQKPGHNNRLFAVKYKVDEPDIIVTGGWDMNVNVWDRRTGDVVTTIYGPKIAGDAIDIKDNVILTAANRGTDQLQLWDWRQNKLLHTFRWTDHLQNANTALFAAQFCKNSATTLIACGGNQLKQFNLEDFKQTVEIRFTEDQSLYSCDSSASSSKFLAGGKLGNLTFLGSNKTQ